MELRSRGRSARRSPIPGLTTCRPGMQRYARSHAPLHGPEHDALVNPVTFPNCPALQGPVIAGASSTTQRNTADQHPQTFLARPYRDPTERLPARRGSRLQATPFTTRNGNTTSLSQLKQSEALVPMLPTDPRVATGHPYRDTIQATLHPHLCTNYSTGHLTSRTVPRGTTGIDSSLSTVPG